MTNGMPRMNGIADYLFIRHLGAGVHGQVWLARPPARLGLGVQHVAVKTLSVRAGAAATRRLVAQLGRHANADSPFVVRLYDAGQHDGHPFYTSAYQPGGVLGTVAADLTTSRLLRVVACAARGIHALHEAGVAHGAITPHNVFVSDDGGKVGDLALTQVLQPGQTLTPGSPAAALEYLAPEMILRSSGSRAADVWALGATLHEALTATTLFPGLEPGDPLACLRHVLTTPPSVDSGLGPEVRDLISDCLARDPADRPRTAEAVADRLDVLASQEAHQ